MPIYAYRCAGCGHAQDVLQKMSDPVLSVCPACGAARFEKQLTAAGFQLKGSGWYVTDFRGGPTGAKKEDESKTAADAAKVEAKPAEKGGEKAGEKASAPPTEKADTKPAAAPAPAPTAAPTGPGS
ncbi:MAG: zinc ribbon domain-containing protein [Rubrivivax sp.]|nr:zinc ribbon domain-containing protein [Rubrivivax sp.]